MKKTRNLLRICLPFFFLIFAMPDANGQILKKLKKRAEKSAERTVERRVEKETSKKTDEVLDSILEPGKKGKQPTNKDGTPIPPNQPDTNEQEGNAPMTDEGETKSIKVYSKFDFVPGDKLLFYDDFSNDFIGDFPAKWNTNGSGEVVTVDELPQRWLELLPGYNLAYIPDVPALPEEYTIEFDILTYGLDKKTSSTAILQVQLSDDSQFRSGDNYAHINIPFCQYSAIGIRVKNYINRGSKDGAINSVVTADLREAVLNRPHISIAVNKQRVRMWVNEKKYVDVPRLIGASGSLKALKFHLNNFKDGKERLFISNVKVAEGGVDLRRKLLAEGRISTNAILFDSGSANIQPQSMGVIRQISQVLQQDSNISLNIIGHTDSDGDDASNLALSKKRAEAVKNALINIYNVSSDRLTSEGKGETEPVSDNGTSDGKSQNRRVEFIKM